MKRREEVRGEIRGEIREEIREEISGETAEIRRGEERSGKERKSYNENEEWRNNITKGRKEMRENYER